MNRILPILTVGILVLLAGCVGITTYESPEPVVDDETLSETGYELEEKDEIVLNRSVLNTTDVEVISKINRYGLDNSEENTTFPLPPSQYMALSTPSVSPGGVELNPIVVDPTDSTFDRVQNRIGEELEIGEKVDEINTTHSDGTNITVEKYEGEILVDDVSASFDAVILASVMEKDDGVLITVSAYPEDSEANQEEKAIQLMENTTVDQN